MGAYVAQRPLDIGHMARWDGSIAPIGEHVTWGR